MKDRFKYLLDTILKKEYFLLPILVLSHTHTYMCVYILHCAVIHR